MLSVILTCYNQDDITLVHVREAMRSHKWPDEIIVINDGGDPGLLPKLEKLEFNCRAIYARVDQDIPWNYNGACNLGAFLASGELLAFEDNDNIPTPHFYTEVLEYLKQHPEIGRISARQRYVVSREDMLIKPRADWKVIKRIGPNQGTAVIRREVYAQIKGMDERFSGEYGWLYYDFRRRLLNQAKIRFGSVGAYFYTSDGQSNLSRSMSQRNQSLLKRNTREQVLQSPIGILNFTYTMKVLHP